MDNKKAITILQSVRANTANALIARVAIREALDMAIAALEQQGEDNEWCLDCKEYDKEQHCCHRFTKVIRQAVEDHRREWQEQQRWIPVTERLPEDEYVLISQKPTKLSGSKWCVGIGIRIADPRSGKIQWRDSGFGVIQDDKVLAWMPLPAPYQEDEA